MDDIRMIGWVAFDLYSLTTVPFTVTMSEQDPLLPTHNDTDANANADASPPSEGRFAAYRERTAYTLESKALHKTVIALVRILISHRT
jgi:hypothetical protein